MNWVRFKACMENLIMLTIFNIRCPDTNLKIMNCKI
jgi:hypothetical protein